MSLSTQSVSAIIDLIENKLSCMSVNDRDDLRDKVMLQRALNELSALTGMTSSMDEAAFGMVPRRGRRRRIQTESFV
jgi:hypothetical protein